MSSGLMSVNAHTDRGGQGLGPGGCRRFLSVLTCAALHHPGFELDDGVGIVAALLPLAAQMAVLSAQVQVAQGAERPDLLHTEALHLERQAPVGGEGRGRGSGRERKRKSRKRRTGRTHLLASKAWRALEQMA